MFRATTGSRNPLSSSRRAALDPANWRAQRRCCIGGRMRLVLWLFVLRRRAAVAGVWCCCSRCPFSSTWPFATRSNRLARGRAPSTRRPAARRSGPHPLIVVAAWSRCSGSSRLHGASSGSASSSCPRSTRASSRRLRASSSWARPSSTPTLGHAPARPRGRGLLDGVRTTTALTVGVEEDTLTPRDRRPPHRRA